MPDPKAMSDYEKSGRVFGGVGASSIVRSSFFATKDDAEAQRRLEAERRLDAYEDSFADVLKARISATYTQENAAELIKVLDTTNNPLKRITNEISVLYTKPPARKLSDSASTAVWRDVLKNAGAAVVFPRLNRLVNLLNTVLVYVRPCDDSLTLRLILPSDCTVWPDPNDPTMPLCVEFDECDPAAPNAEPTYHQWDRRPGSAGYRKYDANRKLVEKLPNPYFDARGRQIIPIVAFHREWPTWSFWDQTSGADVYELTIMVGMWETWINHLIRTDSIQQKWAGGLVDTSGQQQGGTTSILSIRGVKGEPVSVGQFNSQSDWDGLGNQIKRKLENVLNNMGLVSPDTHTSGNPTSGFALTVRSQGLAKIQRAQIPSCERSEETLYRVGSTVWNFERNNSQFQIKGEELPPPSIAKPTIEYADVESARTVEEHAAELEMAESRIRMGLASPISVYMDRHPEATEDVARAAIMKNLADTESLKSAPKPTPGPPDAGAPPQKPEDESNRDDEEMPATE